MNPSASQTRALNWDLKHLAARAYGVANWSADTLRCYHAQKSSFSKKDAKLMARLHAWMLVPLTLWPFSITDLMGVCLSCLEKSCGLDERFRLIIDLLPPVPDPDVCEAVAEHERQVQRGDYHDIIKSHAKFEQIEIKLKANAAFNKDWQRIKDTFDVSAYQEHKGVIRRSLSAERNMRPGFSLDMQNPDEPFRLAFDAFCLRWDLYGMQHDEPLLLKLAVNVTPHGTMILIPSFWSFDPPRDMNWRTIKDLHKLRVKGRQGASLKEGLEQRRARFDKLCLLEAEAARQNLKGDRKTRFLLRGIGLSEDTGAKHLQRLRKEFTAP